MKIRDSHVTFVLPRLIEICSCKNVGRKSKTSIVYTIKRGRREEEENISMKTSFAFL